MTEAAVKRTGGRRPGMAGTIGMSGLCEGTRVMTMDGNLPVEYLVTGDRLVTRAGARQILHIAAKPLRDCPVVVRRGALGPGRPMHDLYLAPDQPIHLRSWQGLGVIGSDQPAVAVTRLRDGALIEWGEHPGALLVYELELAQAEVIYAEGLEVMSAQVPHSDLRGIAAA